MEGSSQSVGLQYHVRSISLPSRFHPNATKIESKVQKLKLSLATASPMSPDTIQSGLVGLAELYNCVEELIHSPHTQQALLQHRNGVLVEDALEGSISLLDSCATLKDLLSLMKEHVQDLQSALRRKGGDLSIETHIVAYFCARKKAEKIIANSLSGLKQMENKAGSSLSLDVDQHLFVVIRVLGDVAAVTISVFKSLLLFFSVPCLKTKLCARWSLISKLRTKSSAACERDQVTINQVESIDLALHSLHRFVKVNEINVNVEITQKRLQSLDARVQGFEAGLDLLFRLLIQSRASLLNILAR